MSGAGDIAVSQTDQGLVYPGQETGQTQPPFCPTSNTPVLDRVLFKMLEYTVTTKHCQAPARRENHSHRGEQASSLWDPESSEPHAQLRDSGWKA